MSSYDEMSFSIDAAWYGKTLMSGYRFSLLGVFFSLLRFCSSSKNTKVKRQVGTSFEEVH